MRGVDDHDVHPCVDQRLGALKARVAHRAGRRHPEAPEPVLAGIRVQHRLFGVLQRQQPGELARPVRHQQLLDPPLAHHRLGFLEIGGFGEHREVFVGHHRLDRRVVRGREAHVAVGHDPDHQATRVDHRKAGEIVTLDQRLGVGQRLLGGEGDRIVDDPALEPFHPAHLARLPLDVEVLVDHADAARLGHGDGHAGLGHGVHRRRQQRDVHHDVAGDLRAGIRRRRQDGTFGRHEQNIVEGERLANLHGGSSFGAFVWRFPISPGGRFGKRADANSWGGVQPAPQYGWTRGHRRGRLPEMGDLS